MRKPNPVTISKMGQEFLKAWAEDLLETATYLRDLAPEKPQGGREPR